MNFRDAGKYFQSAPASMMGAEQFYRAAEKYGLGTDNKTLNKIVDLVNQGMSLDEAARKVAKQ